MNSLLYPKESQHRLIESLDGMWRFQFDDKDEIKESIATTPLTSEIQMPVPGSFNDLVTEDWQKNYAGVFWYERDCFIHEVSAEQRLILRFGSATHRATVYVNGHRIGHHEGGFLPFEMDITEAVNFNQMNRISVQLSNELHADTVPAGKTETLLNRKKKVTPFFDFFNYAGLQRSVKLMYVPHTRVVDIDINNELMDTTARIDYAIKVSESIKSLDVQVDLLDEEGQVVAEQTGFTGVLTVEQPHLWQVHHAYLYRLQIKLMKDGHCIDEYEQEVGIRTFAIKGEQFLLNGKPIYLKGFGRHEDFTLTGRSFNAAVMTRDFALMKWCGANCFRTSHYPYDEEEYRLADREGILIIDEVPAVGFTGEVSNFLGKESQSFFAQPTAETLKKRHQAVIADMIQRDKNHPSVIAWSLMNEPETQTEEAKHYFADIFAFARTQDVQQRPLTFTLMLTDNYLNSQCYQFADFIALNRYYGWYVNGGDLLQAQEALRDELHGWQTLPLDKPLIFTEYGADALNSQSMLPDDMWSPQYQVDVLKMFSIEFDRFVIQGELVWNLADFATDPSILRVGGNKKGVFTRDRQPKLAAYYLKERWDKK